MKIIRHLTSEGLAYAALQSDGTARAIDGDIFGGRINVTDLVVALGEVQSPVQPTTIFGIGLNYKKHAAELGLALVERPLVFIKSNNTVQRPGGVIEIPQTLASDAVDYEGELAVVIGKNCKNATLENALSYILGYTVANDVSARDWQFKLGGGQFCQGKSFDTFCPLGPVLVTVDELGDASALKLETSVNGVLRQEGSTADLIFCVRELIVFLSASKTLQAGTVILTGTPGGAGHTMKPPVYLKPGDIVTVEIEKIGKLTNTVSVER